MESLFDLVGAYKHLYELLTETPDDETINDTLEGVMGELEVKGEGYIAVLDRLDMEIEACKKHKEIWERRLKVRQNAVDRLKKRLVQALVMLGVDELKVGNNTLKLRNNGGVVPLIIDEGKEIPDTYMKVIYEVDKAKIRKDLESGKKLDFARLGERGKNVKW